MEDHDWLAKRFEGSRSHLRAVAYRMLGSANEADDAVQETWLKLGRSDTSAVQNMDGWLTTVLARVCLDMLRSRQSRREESLIPEAKAVSGSNPETEAALADAIGPALLVVLEMLDPAERVAFVLHDVFRYPFAEIAAIVGRTPAACRQLASTARRRISAARAPSTPAPQQAGIVRAFKAAWEAKDIDALISLLDPDATATADGGGLALAFLRPIEGSERIARAWAEIASRVPGNMSFLERTVNGQPGLVAQQDGVTVTVFAFEIAGDRIKRIWVVRNPEKLRPWVTV